MVGKIGRAELPLDSALISMIETVINYLPEFKSDSRGRVLRFRTDGRGTFVYDPVLCLFFMTLARRWLRSPAA